MAIKNGTNGNDTIGGSILADVITSGAGNDYVAAGGGADVVDAGSGNDTVFGGAGADTLTGGSGSDVFYYQDLGDSRGNAFDVITDFQVGIDKIDITRAAGSFDLYWGYKTPTAFGVWIEHKNGDTYIYADYDGMNLTNPDLTIRLVGTHNIGPGDFLGVQNQTPIAVNDVASGTEDSPALTGNVLNNDSDPDQGTQLTVTNFGTYVLSSGVLVLAADGSYTFTVNNAALQGMDTGESLTEAFNYTITDGAATSSALLLITITGANDAPVVTGTSFTVSEDSATVVGGVSASDVDGETLIFSIVGGAPAGVTFNPANGAFIYDPSGNQDLAVGETRTITFQVLANDGTVNSAPATVTITVTGANDAPTIQSAVSVEVDEETSYTGVLMGTDVDTSDVLSYSVTQGDHGVVTLNGDGTYTYTPASGYLGADSFTITVSDGNGGSATQTVNVEVVVANVAPTIAETATASTNEDVPATGNAVGSDADGDALTYSAADGAHGTVSIDASTGAWVYTPNANYHGDDSFVITVSDGSLDATQTVTVTVASVADLTSADDSFSVAEDATLTGSVAGNDSTISGGTLAYTLLTNVAHGTLAFQADGSFTYTPGANYNGGDSFTYVVADVASGESSTQTVTITVNPVNDAPTLTAAVSVSTDEDNAVSGTATASDVENDTLTYSAGNGANGTVSIDGSTGAWTYTPATNFNGGDSFVITVIDGNGGSATQTVTVTVNPVNDAPTIDPTAAVTIAEDTVATGTALASDVEGDVLTYGISAAANGTTSIDLLGNWTYTPNANFNGTDTFAILVSDENGGFTEQTVTVTVTPVADLVSAGESFTTDEDVALSGSVAANDSTTSGGTLTYSLDTDAANGTLVLNTDGSFSYTPDADYNGGDSFTYVVTDADSGESATHTATITVTAVNDAPVIAPTATATVDEDDVVSGSAGASDVDGDALTYQATDGANGNVDIDASTGAWTYTPNANFHGTDTFVIVVHDGAESSSQTVTVTVNPVADLVAGDDSIATDEDTPVAGDVSGNDSTSSGGPLSYAAGAAANGSVVMAADGSYTYTPNANFHGTDTFTYTVTDAASSESLVQTVTVTVAPVVDLAASDDSFTIAEDNLLSGDLSTNDSTTSGGTLSYELGDDAANGTVTVNPDGTFTYLPDLNYFGSDSFTYVVTDAASAESSEQTVTLTITPVNDAPVIADPVTIEIDDTSADDTFAPITGSLSASDVDSPVITYGITGATDNGDGTLSLSSPYGVLTLNRTTGDYSFVVNDAAAEGVAGGVVVTFDYTVNAHDGSASSTNTLTIQVNGANDLPDIGGTSTGALKEDVPSYTTSGALTIADRDVGESSFQVPSVLSGTYGDFTFTASGGWTYTLRNGDANVEALADGQQVSDTLTVTSFDGSTDTDIVITITGTNDQPVVANVTVSGSEDDAAIAGSAVATDVDGDALTYSVVGAEPAGLTFNTDGTFSYDPSADQDLDDGETRNIVFQYKANDDLTDSAVANVTITVNGANDAPVAADASASGTEDDVAISGSVSATDVDVEPMPLTFTLVGAPVAGLTFNPDGTFSYDPSAHQDLAQGTSLDVTFQFVANDGTTNSLPATVTITVNGVNDAPVIVAGGDAGAVVEAGSLDDGTPVAGTPSASGQLIATDVDADADLNWSGDAAGTYGSLTIDASTGQWTYALDNDLPATQSLSEGQSAQDVFTVTVTDEFGATDTQQVTITISGTNDAPVIAAGGDTGLVWEAGNLDNVTEAPAAANLRFEPNQTVDVAALLTPGYDMDVVLANVQGQLNAAHPGATLADAIAVVWDYVDDNFSYYNSAINEVGARLGVAYADYLVAGGKPLLDVTVKFTADGGDAGSDPDRLQSMHDNLLGNVNGFGLADKLNGGGDVPAGSNPSPQPGLYDELVALMTSHGHAALLGRPVYSGNEGVVNNSLAWDQANGYVPAASGQLAVTDVDNGAMHTWSGNAVGDYGTFAIDALTGAWTYTLDNAAAQGLKEGQTETEEFVVTVTDEFGASDTRTVTVTVKGSNDAPVAMADTATLGENQSALIDVVSNDADVDDDAVLTVAGATIAGGAGGSVLVSGGSIAFDPGAAYDSLAAGDSTSVVIDYVVADEFGATSRSTLTLTIDGVNDSASITGTATDAVLEAGGDTNGNTGDPAASGSLTVNDVDAGENVFQTVAPAALAGVYGTFTFDELTGAWTYALDNNDPDTEALVAGQIVADSLMVTSLDGTASQNIVVTIVGANDNPVANADTATTSENSSIVVDVVANDTDVDAIHDLNIVSISAVGVGGSVSFLGDEITFDPGTAYDYLAVGQSTVVNVQYTLGDGSGGTDNGNLAITVTGENDGPVITGGDVTGSVTESGDLPQMWEAGFVGKLEPHSALDNAVLVEVAAAGGLPADPAAMDALLSAVMASQYIDKALAIAAVWDNLDDLYSSYYVDDVNMAFVLLGVEYASSLLAGEVSSLINVTAKYTADGPDGGSAPDRLQSMHDNLLGNLTQIGISDRFGHLPLVRDELLALVSSVDADLLTRPVFSGDESAGPDTASRAFDNANGFVNKVTGQLSATDVDDGAVLTWSGSANGTYGSLVMAADGKWTYNLDDQLATTQALAVGETATESFVVTVTDEHGANDSTTVTITVTGTNDAPEIISAITSGAVTEGATLNDSGEIVFADVDVNDMHDVLVTPMAPGYLGTFTPSLNQAAKTVEWTFTVADDAVNHLAAGEMLTQIYRVGIIDGNGGVVVQNVTVTITGANDTPTITSAVSTVTDEDTVVTGTADGDDVDANDTLTYSAVDGGNGSVTINASSGEWAYTPDANYSGTDSFVITVTDGLASATQTVTVTVNPAVADDIGDIQWIGLEPTSGSAVPAVNDVIADLEPDVVGFEFRAGAGSATQFSIAANGAVQVVSALAQNSVYTVNVEAVSSAYNTVEYTETFTVRTGSGGTDTINADASDNVIYGLAGADVINGNGGDDVLYGQNGNDSLSGGSGNDLLFGDGNNDTLNGGTGDDTLVGGAGNDQFHFGLDAGSDVVFDNNTGTSNGDRLVILAGGAALDSLNVSYNDVDNNVVVAFDGNLVTVINGAGNEIEQVAFDNATYLGYSFGTNVYDLVLSGTGGTGRDLLAGTQSGDVLQGLGGADVLFGNDGNDTLDGGAAADLLLGGDGDDSLTGGTAGDTLIGGAGNDVIDAGGNGDQDVIAYFDANSGTDVINAFDANAAGGQDFINLDGLFDSLGFTNAQRAFGEGFTIVMNGLYIDLDNDNSNGFEYHLATVNIVGAVTTANAFDAADVIVGTL